MKVVAKRPESMVPVQTKYCAGCGHGVVHRIICELIDEMGLRDRAIITNPVGCAIWADLYFDFDSVQPAHGRTPAAATGIKRVLNDHLVICYQGDGDLAAIGTAEIIHAANRGEKFTTVFVNNAIYGMTAARWRRPPWSVSGHRAVGPRSRSRRHGYPYGYAKCSRRLKAPVSRTGTVTTPANVQKLKVI